MLSYTLLVMATGLLTRAVAAASAPVCVSSSDGYQVGQVDYLFNTFCNQLASNGFKTQQQVYGTPYISFDYTSTSTSAAGDLNSCLASYQTLVNSCALPNSTIWGTGRIDAGYGVYNFSIWNTAEYPAVGTATTTIIGATLTTAPIITSTSSSYSLISTSSSSSTPISTSATLTASSTLSTPVYYSNGTSTSSSAYGAASGSGVGVSVTGSTTLPVTPATTTKPAAASTALGNGAEMVRTSGFSLMAVTVACVFMWWF